ncbi:hypothetical protein EIN_118220 [Entamoeba invadens IP1]|uniref:Uncharacterized protein n=1 Tax=Entamoeba invadens IP1 TaxID=370355 RepID=L7FMT4_ENTIV|nr:hypothetical protein EIN_118220 [Entamoeba invadens IP1]ELP92248.1 hypothetical protein EIN_118220 [Entamoeba invadens IP1]|eukprot:XP_004259019.1 hypothetical protein EIN_118220 [Entamoeba invadens IP1]
MVKTLSTNQDAETLDLFNRVDHFQLMMTELIEHDTSFFNCPKELKCIIEEKLDSFTHALKYDRYLRVGYTEEDCGDVVFSETERALLSILQMQEKQLKQIEDLNLFIDKRWDDKIQSSVNPSVVENMEESLEEQTVQANDIVEYCTQYMITANKLNDLVGVLNAQTESLNNSNNFTAFEGLLNSTECKEEIIDE